MVDTINRRTVAIEHIPIQPLLSKNIHESYPIRTLKLFQTRRLLDTSRLGIMQKVDHLQLLQWMNAGFQIPVYYMDKKMPPKIEDMININTERRLTETNACFTSGVIPVSGLFIFHPWK